MSSCLILERLSSMYTIETLLLFSLRCVKLLETVKEMLLSFPINDPTNEEMFAKLEKIRAKFRQVTYVHCTVKSCLVFSQINAYICMGTQEKITDSHYWIF